MFDEYGNPIDLEGDYETTGDYETGRANPYAAQRGRAQSRAIVPTGRGMAPGRAIPVSRGALAPGAMQTLMRQNPGLTEAQVRAIVAAEMARLNPYGAVPPRPHADEAMFPMGLGSAELTPAVSSIVLTAAPQRAFRGERLVLDIQRNAAAADVVPLLTAFNVGDYKQLVGGGALPVTVFKSDAFGVRLMLDAAQPGIAIAITITATVPVGGSVIVSGAIVGRATDTGNR